MSGAPVRIEAGDVRSALAAAWPELATFLALRETDPDLHGLWYLEMADIARFLAGSLQAGDADRFGAFFEALERCLVEGSEDAVGLGVSLLEDLQNSAITTIDDASVWQPFLGASSRRAWRAVESFWNGDLTAIAYFQAQP